MVDPKQRHELAQDVRRLITGRMTNDEFDDAYYERYSESADLAIREIGRFCWGLYSSDLPLPYRLRGRYAVDSATRKKAAHAVLFLQTNLEYAYPETPDSFSDSMVGCAWFNGALVGIAFLVIALLCAAGGVFDVAGSCLLVGVAILGICACIRWAQRHTYQPFLDACDAAGDTSVWPFADTESVNVANGNNYLLSNFRPDIAT
jgi:hypothetical protein